MTWKLGIGALEIPCWIFKDKLALVGDRVGGHILFYFRRSLYILSVGMTNETCKLHINYIHTVYNGMFQSSGIGDVVAIVGSAVYHDGSSAGTIKRQ